MLQVLADYAVLILHIKSTIEGAANCPIVNFGGSYGGTLSTYFRVRYPGLYVPPTVNVTFCLVTRC